MPHTWSAVALQALTVYPPAPQPPGVQTPVQGEKPVALKETPGTHGEAQANWPALQLYPAVALQPHVDWPVTLSET